MRTQFRKTKGRENNEQRRGSTHTHTLTQKKEKEKEEDEERKKHNNIGHKRAQEQMYKIYKQRLAHTQNSKKQI